MQPKTNGIDMDETPSQAQTPTPPGFFGARWLDLAQVLRFYSRLPVPIFVFDREPHALPDFNRVVWAVPVAGAIIGAIGASIGAGAMVIGLSPLIAATLTIAILVVITGCFHEDGLADSCDGLWGGHTPERRLEIMKDSRIGSYGAAGLGLTLLLRVLALSELFRHFGPMGALLMIGIASASRTLSLMLTQVMPPAQPESLAGRTHMPGEKAYAIALFIGIGLLTALATWFDLLIGLVVTANAVVLVIWMAISLAKSKIGGFTGDILGATQQLVDITLLLGLSAAAAWHGPV